MQHTQQRSWLLIVLMLLALLLVTAYFSLTLGGLHLSFREIADAIVNPDDSMEYVILTRIRLPRLLLGLGVGGALSLAGVILQGIYHNPLVEPYTLGISGGASLGVALAIVLGLPAAFGHVALPLSGFLGAVPIIFLIYFMGTRQNQIRIQSMLLTGVMISFITSSAIMLLMATTTSENLHGILFWTMGSLDEPNSNLIITVCATAVFGLALSYLFIQPLNAMRMGTEKASHVGINTDRSIRILFLTASLLTGVSVSVAGVIGFVGLIIPHIMRQLVGTDYRILLVSSFFGGGIFLMLSDLLARTVISPNELPVGVITGIIGGSVFIYILSRSKTIK